MLYETVLLAQREIRRNVMRSTILGIVIGVAAVITMVTIGNGATAQVTSDITKLGSNMLQVRPGQGHRGPGGAQSESAPFSAEDATAIEQSVAGLAAVAPTANKMAQAVFGNQNRSVTVTGSTNGFLTVRDWKIISGRKFTEGEQRAVRVHHRHHSPGRTFRGTGTYRRNHPAAKDFF